MLNTHAARIRISVGLVLAMLVTGAIAQDPSCEGTWTGAINYKNRGKTVEALTTLSIEKPQGSNQAGDLRISSPFACNIALERVAPTDSGYLFNVTQTSTAGFCRRYAGGKVYLTPTDTPKGCKIRLETASDDPDYSQTGTLGRPQ